MIYPSIATRIPNNVDVFNKLRICLKNVFLSSDIILPQDEFLYVVSESQSVKSSKELSIPIKILDVEEFIETLYTFYTNARNYLMGLQVGDLVTIETRLGTAEQYPCYYADEMCELSGRSFRILSISDGLKSASDSKKLFYNGIDRTFNLEDDAMGYTWHSSMIAIEQFASIKKISLFSIKTSTLLDSLI